MYAYGLHARIAHKMPQLNGADAHVTCIFAPHSPQLGNAVHFELGAGSAFLAEPRPFLTREIAVQLAIRILSMVRRITS